MISRHFVDIGRRRVHYRRCGRGPALLMIHQSPRSSAEYEALMEEWSAHFTCIAPDTPGFGQSQPLAGEPEIAEFADALIATMDALGLDRPLAYGFHSGAVILMEAIRRAPTRFARTAMGGYAVWTESEMALFGQSYLPPFRASAYGEHLTWLWNRMLEQSWFFPWFDTRPAARLSGAHADIARVHAAVMEMLDSGAAYRAGYGAVLRATRAIPDAAPNLPPTLITAYDGDPLQAHIARLGVLPEGWQAQVVATPDQHRAQSLAWLLEGAALDAPPPVEVADEGFVQVAAAGFAGLLHWRGRRDDASLSCAAPGSSAALTDAALAFDPPGHGLSDDWPDAPRDLPSWRAVADAAATALGVGEIVMPDPAIGDPALLFPSLEPDCFGTHLTRAWGIVRAETMFSPWHDADAAHAIDFDPVALEPECLAPRVLARLQARRAQPFAAALAASDV